MTRSNCCNGYFVLSPVSIWDEWEKIMTRSNCWNRYLVLSPVYILDEWVKIMTRSNCWNRYLVLSPVYILDEWEKIMTRSNCWNSYLVLSPVYIWDDECENSPWQDPIAGIDILFSAQCTSEMRGRTPHDKIKLLEWISCSQPSVHLVLSPVYTQDEWENSPWQDQVAVMDILVSVQCTFRSQPSVHLGWVGELPMTRSNCCNGYLVLSPLYILFSAQCTPGMSGRTPHDKIKLL